MNKVFFHFVDRKIRVNKIGKIKRLIILVFKNEKLSFHRLDYIFCSDQYLLSLNQKFLSHNYYTDILTFYLNKPNESIKGEIYISLDRLKENSGKFEVSFFEELLRVLLHGALHLCGYKDKTKKEQRLMRSIEDYYIHLF